jgi:hypothetical protein
MPLGRFGLAGTLWKGRIVVAGGYTDDVASSNRVDLFDPEAGSWSRGPDLPAATEYSSLAVLGDRLYLVGGLVKQPEGEPTNAVYSIGPGEKAWRKEASLLVPRGGVATVAVGDVLLAMGGTNATGVLRSTEIFDPATGWRPGPDLLEPRERLATAVVGSKVYAIAGRQGAGDSLASVESFDLSTGTAWQAEAKLGTAREYPAGAAVAGRPCVTGGEIPYQDDPSAECLTGGRWEVAAEFEEPRHGLVAVAVGRRLHLIGGGSASGLYVSPAHVVLDFGA